jgi:hypothetical protein
LQTVTDDIGVRQLAFMWKHFPGGKKKGRWKMENGGWRFSSFADFGLWALDFGWQCQPRFQILLEAFLLFQVVRDDDQRPVRKKFSDQRRQKGLRGNADTGARQRSAMLQSPGEGLHGGSLRDISEQAACRRRLCVMRQARRKSQ